MHKNLTLTPANWPIIVGCLVSSMLTHRTPKTVLDGFFYGLGLYYLLAIGIAIVFPKSLFFTYPGFRKYFMKDISSRTP